MKPKIKVAQIGVGYWGPNLLRNLASNPRCELLMCVDLSEDRKNYVKSLYPKIEVSGHVEDVFNNSEIDAVVIATPVKTHYELAIKALKNKKHILVEKPMARTVKEVEEIEFLSEKNELIAMSGHTFLFNPAVKKIKEIISSGDIGEIRYIYSQRLNLGRIRNDVDALWNLAPHDISIIKFWLEDLKPLKVSRNGMDYLQKGIEDVSFLTLTYSNNILVNIHVSWLDPNKIRKITVVGSKKMIVYDDLSKNKIAIYDKGIDRKAVLGENMDFDNNQIFNFNHRSGDVKFPSVNWEEPLSSEINHFFDCIQHKYKCLTGINHTKDVISILQKASIK